MTDEKDRNNYGEPQKAYQLGAYQLRHVCYCVLAVNFRKFPKKSKNVEICTYAYVYTRIYMIYVYTYMIHVYT